MHPPLPAYGPSLSLLPWWFYPYTPGFILNFHLGRAFWALLAWFMPKLNFKKLNPRNKPNPPLSAPALTSLPPELHQNSLPALLRPTRGTAVTPRLPRSMAARVS